MWDRLQKYLRKLREPKAKRLTLDEMWGIYLRWDDISSPEIIKIVYPKHKPKDLDEIFKLSILGMASNGNEHFHEFVEKLVSHA